MQQACMWLLWRWFFMFTDMAQLQKAFPFWQHPHRLSPLDGIIFKCIQRAFLNSSSVNRIGFNPLNLVPLLSFIRIIDISIHVGVFHLNDCLVDYLEPIHVDHLSFIDRSRSLGNSFFFSSFWLQIHFKYLYLRNICWRRRTPNDGGRLLMIDYLKLRKWFGLWFTLLFFLEMVLNNIQLINCILLR